MTRPKIVHFQQNGWTAKGIVAEHADGSGSYSIPLFDDEPPYPEDNALAVGDVTWARYRIRGATFDVPVIDLGSAYHGSMEACKNAGPTTYAHVVHHLNRPFIADHEGFYSVRGETTLLCSANGAIAHNVYDEDVEFVKEAAKRQDLEQDD